jgi:hypothetical protein
MIKYMKTIKTIGELNDELSFSSAIFLDFPDGRLNWENVDAYFEALSGAFSRVCKKNDDWKIKLEKCQQSLKSYRNNIGAGLLINELIDYVNER